MAETRDDPICGRCGCYRSAHGEGERCEPVGWTFTLSMPLDEGLVEVAAEAMVAVYHAQSFSSPNEKVTPVDRQAVRAAIEAIGHTTPVSEGERPSLP